VIRIVQAEKPGEYQKSASFWKSSNPPWLSSSPLLAVAAARTLRSMSEGFLIKLTHKKTGEIRWLGEFTLRKVLEAKSTLDESELDDAEQLDAAEAEDLDEDDEELDKPHASLFDSFDRAKRYLYPDHESVLAALLRAEFIKTENLDAEVIEV
jgi:hypothetical protein